MPSSLLARYLKSIGRRQGLLSLENIRETNVVETSLCSTEIAGKINQGRIKTTYCVSCCLIKGALLKSFVISVVGQICKVDTCVNLVEVQETITC